PVIGILRNHPRTPADVVVVHSAPTADEMLFRDELRAMDAAGRIRFVERITGRDGAEVRLPVHRIGDVVPDWRERHTWACGPTGMLDEAEEHWAAHALADRLHTERFRTRLAAVGDGGEIDFSASGTTVEADGSTTILDAGEGAGVLMKSGCRMGICFNCVVPLRDGSVRDLRTGEITTATPEDPVLIQTCVSAAAGACQLDL
ncbi:MAG: iron-sulfur cluster-binding domain-containing protein, partial [Propionibacterium sp.]|nr:iron-sulfur cluster-binding domain-containing protein [Propionibacterium sp.]